MKQNNYFAAYAFAMAFVLALFVLSLFWGVSTREYLLAEGGPIELPSALLYFVCFGLICYRGGLSFLRNYAYLALIPPLFGMRELDLHKAFTTTGIFKIRFFTSSEVPFYEKIFGLLVIAALIYMLYALIRHQTKNYLTEVRAFTPLALGATLVAGLVVVSKTIDGLERKLESIGLTASSLIAEHSTSLEEILELGIPIVMIIAFLYYFNRRVLELGQPRETADA